LVLDRRPSGAFEQNDEGDEDWGIVNLTIPRIMTSLSADLNHIQWVRIVSMIDRHLDRNPTYATATLVGGLLTFGVYSSGWLVTLFLQDFLE
jgi:hypothetical protein